MEVYGPGARAYFKACADPGRHEAALVPKLAEAFPELVPAPLAFSERKGWLLLPDCGSILNGQSGDPDAWNAWLEVLSRYASLQVWAATRREDWVRMHMPDRRPEYLPEMLRALLVDDSSICLGRPDGLTKLEQREMLGLVPDFEEACRELTGGPILPSLDHGDLHKNNLLALDNGYRLVDWGDSCLAHPFSSLATTLDGLGGGLLDADGWSRGTALRRTYLDAWSDAAAQDVLERTFKTALWVGHIGRVLNFQHMLAPANDHFRQRFLPLIPKWLRQWRDRREFLF